MVNNIIYTDTSISECTGEFVVRHMLVQQRLVKILWFAYLSMGAVLSALFRVSRVFDPHRSSAVGNSAHG